MCVVLCIKHNINYPLINVCFSFVLLSFGALYAAKSIALLFLSRLSFSRFRYRCRSRCVLSLTLLLLFLHGYNMFTQILLSDKLLYTFLSLFLSLALPSGINTGSSGPFRSERQSFRLELCEYDLSTCIMKIDIYSLCDRLVRGPQ